MSAADGPPCPARPDSGRPIFGPSGFGTQPQAAIEQVAPDATSREAYTLQGGVAELPVPPERPTSAAASRSPSDHLDRIDVLRAIAILLVLGYHGLRFVTGQWELSSNRPWQTLLAWGLYPLTLGWSGVSLFFVISGFCIHLSFLKQEAAQKQAGLADFVGGFFWRRFWRIYPPYLVALVGLGYWNSRHPEWRFSARDFWLHFFLAHNFSTGTFYSINGAFWSLAVEMQFYGLFPLVLWLRQKFGLKATFWLFAAVSVVCRIVALAVQDWRGSPTPTIWCSTPILFVDWLLGVWLAERWFAGERLFGVSKRQAVAAGFLALALSWNKVTSAALGYTAFSLWYAMLTELYLLRRARLSTLEKWAIPIGLCSYSIYLWHQPLIGRVYFRLNHAGLPQTRAAAMCVLPVVLGLMVLLGYTAYRAIELPSIGIGKRLLKARKNIPAGSNFMKQDS